MVVRSCEYGTPTVPLGKKFDVDVSRRGTTVKVNACVPDEDGGPALTALTVKLKVLFRGSCTEAAE